MENIYVPKEVMRHILSYSKYPSASRVSTSYRDIEQSLAEERVDRLYEQYGEVDSALEADANEKDILLLLSIPSKIQIYDIGVVVVDMTRRGYLRSLQRLASLDLIPTDMYNEIPIWAAESGVMNVLVWSMSLVNPDLVAIGMAAKEHEHNNISKYIYSIDPSIEDRVNRAMEENIYHSIEQYGSYW
jgi:hypothetical protein